VALPAALAIVSSVFPQVALSIRVLFGCLRSHGVVCPAGDFSARVHSVVTFTNGFVLAYLKGI
jgi:hypothetical protein